MRKLIVVLLLLTTSLFSVAKNKHKKKPPAGPQIMSVSVYHTACYGRCPTYKIEVNKDGLATFTGIRFTPDSGVFTKNLGNATAKEIIEPFLIARIDTFPDRYQSRVQDLPGIVLTITFSDSVKTISNANFGPPLLGRLRIKLDSILGPKRNEAGIILLDESWHKQAGDH